jgi:hypothetical protein
MYKYYDIMRNSKDKKLLRYKMLLLAKDDPSMPETVSDPDLVIVKNQMAGIPSRTMYIKGYMDGRFVRGLVVVVDGENVNQIISAYTVNTVGNFPKIPKWGDWHDQKTATEIDIKNIFAIISDRAKHGTEDVEFKLIYPEEIDLLK